MTDQLAPLPTHSPATLITLDERKAMAEPEAYLHYILVCGSTYTLCGGRVGYEVPQGKQPPAELKECPACAMKKGGLL